MAPRRPASCRFSDAFLRLRWNIKLFTTAQLSPLKLKNIKATFQGHRSTPAKFLKDKKVVEFQSETARTPRVAYDAVKKPTIKHVLCAIKKICCNVTRCRDAGAPLTTLPISELPRSAARRDVIFMLRLLLSLIADHSLRFASFSKALTTRPIVG